MQTHIETIYSLRSNIDCIRKGIGYVIYRPWLTTKVMGLWAVVFACLYVIYRWMLAKTNINALPTGVYDMNDIVMTAVAYTLTCLATQLFIARLFILFRRTEAMVERKALEEAINQGKDVTLPELVIPTMKDKVKEIVSVTVSTLPFTLWLYILACPFLGISELLLSLITSQPTLTRQCMVGTACLVCLCLLAFILTTLVYPMYNKAMTVRNKEKTLERNTFREGIKIGFKHKGKTFMVMTLSAIIAVILCIVPILPLIISETALNNSIFSILIHNDDSGIPVSGMWLMFAVDAISLTVATLISIIPYSCLLYLYGTINVHEREKDGIVETTKFPKQ